MKRRHWIEISDHAWCPQTIKNAVTDYCRFVLAASKCYHAIAPVLAWALQSEIVPCCQRFVGPATQDMNTAREPSVQCSERLRRRVLETCRSESADRGNRTY